jgi:hypothetical protein
MVYIIDADLINRIPPRSNPLLYTILVIVIGAMSHRFLLQSVVRQAYYASIRY